MLQEQPQQTRSLDIPRDIDAPWIDEIDSASGAPRRTVEALRIERGWSQCELAGRAGLLPDHLRAIELGMEPTLPERQMIADALGVDVASIA
ncbi:helix-turn-helix transcriptional regulator [Kaistia dalseonensis]|uniref:Lambda repressor-like predicted transcriptional regulator n=1 Tax=Kaistia dalseonensis TaxID=410840 RepID=A0ABU0H3V6_9HYPH|nr:helix-turn-helix transcriptional regulator [Kaistia dalseonensis]MCX5493637.1 helix-turn-helix transcriptional regulator [Kaistia dalseonensis]MDQ0436199.1 lambda repressor-like predicted transcriptional regulator [Kaistia dalseonensis]